MRWRHLTPLLALAFVTACGSGLPVTPTAASWTTDDTTTAETWTDTTTMPTELPTETESASAPPPVVAAKLNRKTAAGRKATGVAVAGYTCELNKPVRFRGNEIVNRACGYIDSAGRLRSRDPWIDGQLLDSYRTPVPPPAPAPVTRARPVPPPVTTTTPPLARPAPPVTRTAAPVTTSTTFRENGTTTATTSRQTVVTTTTASGGGSVHQGSFCSHAGAVGQTSAGTDMVCGPGSDGRLRWQAA